MTLSNDFLTRVCAALIVLCLGLAQGVAATLNFDTLPSGQTTTPLSMPNVAISESSGGALFVYHTGEFGMPAGGGVCALQSDFSCTGDVSLLFIGPVKNLKFKGLFATGTDRATIAAYAGDTLVTYAVVSGGSEGEFDVDLSKASGITRLKITDRSDATSRGISFGGFGYDPDSGGIPGPAQEPLQVLSFDGFKSGRNGKVLDLGNALLTGLDGAILFVYRKDDYGIEENGAICALNAESRCMGSFTIEFDKAITDLTFAGFFAKVTDAVWITLFDGDTLLIRQFFQGNASGTIRFDFSDYARLTKLLFEDESSALTKGIAYGDFKFRYYKEPLPPIKIPPKDPVAQIPLPPAMLLLLGAIVLLPGMRKGLQWRSRRTVAAQSRAVAASGRG